MRQPLIPFVASMMSGIAIGNYYHIDNRYLLVCLFFTFAALLLASLKKWKVLSIWLLMLSFLFLGVININLYLYQDKDPKHIFHHIDKENVTLEGFIFENPEVSPDRTEITVSTTRMIHDDKKIPVGGLVLLSVKNPQINFKYGDYVRFRSRLKSPHNFCNPGGFDYEKNLRYRGISVRGFIKDPSGIIVLRENQGNIFKIHLERFRGNLKKLIRENSLSPEGEIIQAMILGDQKEIPRDVMDKFNKTGTTHIIAISGFNIGIIAMFSVIIIRLLRNFMPNKGFLRTYSASERFQSDGIS